MLTDELLEIADDIQELAARRPEDKAITDIADKLKPIFKDNYVYDCCICGKKTVNTSEQCSKCRDEVPEN